MQKDLKKFFPTANLNLCCFASLLIYIITSLMTFRVCLHTECSEFLSSFHKNSFSAYELPGPVLCVGEKARELAAWEGVRIKLAVSGYLNRGHEVRDIVLKQ